MLNWASEEGRQWVIAHGALVELGISLDVNGLPPQVSLSPHVNELADLGRMLVGLMLAGGYKDLAGQCARGGFAFQWRCKLADLAKACTAWPNDIAPRVYASADKAFTIEANKRRHVQADKLALATELIAQLREVFKLARDRDDEVSTARVEALLAQWDALKGT